MELLKLVALDRDDLEVVSTHLQDATVSVADVHWRPTEKRLVMSLARFDWAGSLCESAQFQRRRTALRFDRVNAIKCRNVDCKNRRAMFNLLAVENAPDLRLIIYTPVAGESAQKARRLFAE